MQTILTNGPVSNRLNIVVLSEGYTSNQLAQFAVDATNVVNALLSHPPYQEYSNYFNAFAVKVASNQSGSDHPASGITRDTYFNSTYDPLSDYLITIPADSTGQGKVDALLQAFMPACQLPVLVVNDSTDGGSDGFYKTAIVSTAALAYETSIGQPGILTHETGHVLANLGDEYTTPHPGFPDTEEPNTTQQTNHALIKWKAWIDAATPVPTPDSYGDGAVGLFEGAHYHTTNWYRPELNCLMGSLGVPFCSVCSEALVLAIYQRVRPVDGSSPASTNLSVTTTQALAFSLALLQPATHNLNVQWLTNGVPLIGATNLDFMLLPQSLPKGTNWVSAVVEDNTPLVRNDPTNLLSQTVSWTLNVGSPCGSYAFALSSPSYAAGGASGTFTVTPSGDSCAWNITSPSWLHLSSSSGVAPYSGTFTVDANGGSDRNGVVSLSGGNTNINSSVTQKAGVVPGTVVLLTPTNTASLPTRQPQFSWAEPDPAATWFHLYVTRNNSKYLDQWVQGAINWAAATDWPGGNYSWWIQPYNSAGLGAWSTNFTFIITSVIPANIILVAPAGSMDLTATQRYTWKADSAATWYELFVVRNGSGFWDEWVAASNSVSGDLANFAADVSGHDAGTYQWWVRGWSPDGLGPWSGPMTFSLGIPGAVSLLTLTNNAQVLVRQPELTWTASSPAASWYYLYLTRNGSKYLDQWVAGSTNWVVTSGLPGGTYIWWVHPWNEVGYGPWSTNFTFTIQTAVPGALTLLSPSGSVTAGSTQRYIWQADPAATWYELYVMRNGSAFGDHWYTLTNSVVDSTTGNFAVVVNGHTSGSYQWWVRGWSPDGLGMWSGNLTFQIP